MLTSQQLLQTMSSLSSTVLRAKWWVWLYQLYVSFFIMCEILRAIAGKNGAFHSGSRWRRSGSEVCSAALGYGKAAGCDGRELLNQDSQGERAGAWGYGVSFTGTYSVSAILMSCPSAKNSSVGWFVAKGSTSQQHYQLGAKWLAHDPFWGQGNGHLVRRCPCSLPVWDSRESKTSGCNIVRLFIKTCHG